VIHLSGIFNIVLVSTFILQLVDSCIKEPSIDKDYALHVHIVYYAVPSIDSSLVYACSMESCLVLVRIAKMKQVSLLVNSKVVAGQLGFLMCCG